jgi:peroxiredoxin
MQAGTSVSGIPQSLGGAVDDFALRDLAGVERRLSDFLSAKKGAVVIFWSGICSHCVRYDGYLNGFTSRHPELGLVAVASRQGETPDQIGKSAAQRGLTFPLLLDPAASVAARWSTQQTPRAFLIDAGRVLLYRGAIDNYKYKGDPDYVAYLEPAIGEFLAGLPIGRPETQSFGCAIQSVYYILPKNL